jgi:hypothetical protein
MTDTSIPAPEPTPAPAAPPRPLKRPALITLIVFSILYLLLLVPAAMFAMLSPFAFDSGTSPEAWQVFIFLVSTPFVLLGGLILPWIFYILKWYLAAIITAALPLVYGCGAYFFFTLTMP